MKKQIDILELFSGIGGFTKGFQEAGYTINTHRFSEVDTHAIACYKYNYKHAESIGSVKNVRGLTTPHVLTFGSPCQDFSLAGKRMGMDGQRSSLITEAIRLISELRPPVFIWENVKGTFSSNDGQDFWAIIAAFAHIGGYRLEWQLLNTSWFLPQNRERIYLIGHLDGRSKPGVFPFGEGNKFYQTPNTFKKEVYENSLTLTAKGNSNNTGSFISVATPGRKEKNQNGSRFKENEMFCLTAEPHGVMLKSNNKQGFEIAEEGNSIHFKNITSSTRNGTVGKTKTQALDTDCNLGVLTQGNIRRLTEIECERLQGFPDNWTKYGIYEKKVWTNKKLGTFEIIEGIHEIPKTQRYKMCGNAVTVAVVKAIAERLEIY